MYTRQNLQSLSIEEIKKILIDYNVKFNSQNSKDELIELIIAKEAETNRPPTSETQNPEKSSEKKEEKKSKKSKDGKTPESIGKAGAILNIIFGVFWCFTIIGMIIGIPAIIFNSRFLKGTNNKKTAGIFGLFVSLIGGIFVLVSDRK